MTTDDTQCAGCAGTGTGIGCEPGWCPVCEGSGVDALAAAEAETAALRAKLEAVAEAFMPIDALAGRHSDLAMVHVAVGDIRKVQRALLDTPKGEGE